MKISDVIPQKYFIYIPDNVFLRLLYFQSRKKLPNTRNPKTFSEKMTWLKIYGNLEEYGLYADKYRVREYVKNIVGETYLVPLIGCWDTFEQIPFENLPNQFVIKATHGSGYNFICKDKSKIDMADLKIKFDAWLDENFYDLYRESQYKNIEPKIICEQYLENENGELWDYKINCINGQPAFIEVHWGRFTHLKVATYYTTWDKMPLDQNEVDSGTEENVPKPENLNEMLLLAKKLSRNLPFVRVDLYSVKGKLFFGELSFTPMEGMPFKGKSDKLMGDMLDIGGFGFSQKKSRLTAKPKPLNNN